MRFFAAVLTTLAVRALAANAPDAKNEDYSTVVVTDYATFCPEATSGALPASTGLPSITVSNGITYSISRPLITSTVTRCNKCPSSTPTAIHTPSTSSIVVVPTSHPLIPSAPAPVPPSAPASSVPVPVPSGASPDTKSTTTGPSVALSTGGASRAAAGAGAGLAGVFALVAYLL
ncbi:putative GPI anchored protein [Aspergillus clavatus NRRL 1]|uniref:GPI anchored protein n=1 Tax=Aspergillus clavatus (strain ATCC 1007 / CBS 513.65 / DSM 816 / NCTC 3887 / NRRL 1 / QM 1276 / 107) TaxID=344612 RepID=A1CSK6_ASPCL|nr:uncharacterized protein ACLA_079770 [Aspergillus clavatus NRRL 1]EAW06293.1 hypothetical protein ACLA_079770 [Aspergillus clavatus NRRL 1]